MLTGAIYRWRRCLPGSVIGLIIAIATTIPTIIYNLIAVIYYKNNIKAESNLLIYRIAISRRHVVYNSLEIALIYFLRLL
jgi:hypothetical protein